ncbi:MAG TPA: COX15/CtaA family protein [Terriglobia bacterium]|nr:COX15/CtaA family protein [Terriglobia bacterium]
MAESRGERLPGKFAAYAWMVLGYNILVILWGTVVRATGSGAGCGEHWPLCQGVVIPHAEQIATLIEFSHRATSGIDALLVAGLVWMGFRRYERGHGIRRYAAASGFFTFTEALVGAALVLFGDVGNKVSTGRVVVLSIHLVNTFMLLAFLALTAWAASRQLSADAGALRPHPVAQGKGPYVIYGAGIAGAIAISITGTIAALADTLYPAQSLAGAFRWDFSGATAPILHLRIIHPVIAVMVGGYLLVVAMLTLSTPGPASSKRMARGMAGLILLQFVIGAANIILLTPLYTQLLHLLVADLVWISLVLLTAESLGWRAESAALRVEPLPAASSASTSVQHLPASR